LAANIRCYTDEALFANKRFVANPWIIKHCKARRIASQSQIELFDGLGTVATATLIDTSTFEIVVESVTTVAIAREIRLAICLSRGNDFDSMIQKVTELGATSIQLLYSDYCQLQWSATQLEQKLKRFRSITIAACEQSFNNQLPKIIRPIKLIDYMQNNTAKDYLVLHQGGAPIKQLYRTPNIFYRSTAIIGPEGGFSQTEMDVFQECNCKLVAMSNNILRSHTAPIAYCSIVGSMI